MKHSAALFIALLLSPVAATRATPSAKPNILWITSEDNSSHWIGCYGNKQTKTPRIDALAKEGVLFENAYSNAPVCAVARATILMGAYRLLFHAVFAKHPRPIRPPRPPAQKPGEGKEHERRQQIGTLQKSRE